MQLRLSKQTFKSQVILNFRKFQSYYTYAFLGIGIYTNTSYPQGSEHPVNMNVKIGTIPGIWIPASMPE